MYAKIVHVHHTHMAGKRGSKAKFRITFIRQWREYRELTLEEVADRVGKATGRGMTHATLSRIERGLLPYSQPILESLAAILNCTTADLLMRSPTDPFEIWSIWERAKLDQRQTINDIAKTIVK